MRRSTIGGSRKGPIIRDCIASIYYNFLRRLSGTGITTQIVLLFVFIQVVWWMYDQNVTSQIKHKVPRPYVPPTESSPLTPFYDEPYIGFARAFPAWPHGEPFPCGSLIPESELNARSPSMEGVLFIKEMKTGSTTLSGITARIARNMAKKLHPEQVNNPNTNATTCTARLVHMRARRLRDRVADKSFLWSVVREPTARLVSKFFHFAVSREDKEPTVKSFMKYVRDNEVYDYGYYFKSLSLRSRMNVYRTELYPTFLQDLLEGYNYIGVSDRMEESLAVLQLLLGLETSDMLHLSTKTSGSYEQFNHKCTKIQQHPITMEMKEWFYTADFESYLEPDVLVYQAVNVSLDLTIKELGQARVWRTVQRLKFAQHLAEEKCAKVTKFPCSSEGVVQEPNDCLLSDVACGYKCLDQVGGELAISDEFQKLPGNFDHIF